MTICKLYYSEIKGRKFLEIEENNEMFMVANNITVEQALSLSKVFTRKYKEVWLYDGDYEAYISIKNSTDKPIVNTYYPEDYNEVAKKYGLYIESDDFDQTDLDKEKWDNYWGDFNQCGVRIDY